MLSLFIFAIFIASQRNVLADCSFTATSLISPLITDSNVNIVSQSTDKQTVFVQCAAGRSSQHLADDGDEAVCEGGTNIRIIRTNATVDYNIIECQPKSSSNEPSSIVQNTNESCYTNGTKLKIGYETHDSFSTVYTVCFDQNYLTPLYAQGYFEFSLEIQEDPETLFDGANMFTGTDLDSLFINQKEIFENLSLSNYITTETYLAQGQLAPYPILLSPFQKYASADYVTVTPIWNEIYTNFLSLNTGVAGATDIYIGTYGVATLPDVDGNLVELYLKNHQIPVPRWIWFYTPADGFHALFYNSPFHTIIDVEGEIMKLCRSYMSYSDNPVVVLCINPIIPLPPQ